MVADVESHVFDGRPQVEIPVDSIVAVHGVDLGDETFVDAAGLQERWF